MAALRLAILLTQAAERGNGILDGLPALQSCSAHLRDLGDLVAGTLVHGETAPALAGEPPGVADPGRGTQVFPPRH